MKLDSAKDDAGKLLQLSQAWIALAVLEAEVKGPMRQSEMLAIIQTQRENINEAGRPLEF